MKNDLITTFSPRQYMLSEDFEIYYYSDTELLSVPNHTHSYYEFYFFLEGEVDMLIQGKALPLSYGDLLVIPPGVPHHALMKSKKHPYRRFVFWISTDFMNGLLELSPDYDYLFKCMEKEQTNRFHFEEFVFGQLQSKVFELLEETFADRFGKAPKVSICVSGLLLHINRAVYWQTVQEKDILMLLKKPPYLCLFPSPSLSQGFQSKQGTILSILDCRCQKRERIVRIFCHRMTLQIHPCVRFLKYIIFLCQSFRDIPWHT